MEKRNPSILVVDDEDRICQTLSAILANNGFQVTTASNVAQALALINDRPFDILLSDLNIGAPGDGFTVASAMRRRWPQAITLIQTVYPDFEAALEAIREQVDDYLVKPIDPDRLLALLQEKVQAPGPAAGCHRRSASQTLSVKTETLSLQTGSSGLKLTPSFSRFLSPTQSTQIICR